MKETAGKGDFVEQFCPSYRQYLDDLANQVEIAQDAFVLLDRDFRFAYVNRKASELLRRPAADLLGRPVWEEYPGHAGTEIERRLRQVMQTGRPDRFENYYPRVDMWYAFQVNPSPSGIAVWFCDITGKKRTQLQVEHSAAMLDAVMENVPEGMSIISLASGRIDWVSRYTAELTRRPREELLGQPIAAYGRLWHVLRPDGSTPIHEELPVARALKGEVIVCEEWLLERADGVRINALYNAAAIRDHAGRILGCVVVWRDISEQKAQQERRMESRRLAAVATLAGGIAHNLNNLLTGVLGNISLVQDRFAPDDPDGKLLQNALDAAEKAASLTRKLLAFGGKSAFTTTEPLDVSRHIRNSEGVIRALIPSHIAFALDLMPEPPPVKADPVQVHEAVVSLLTNAVEAIEQEHGLIALRTCLRELSVKDLERLPNGAAMQPGRYVSIEVSDTGKGIEPQYRDRIFDPFFSTKFLGRGLGLAAVFGVVRGHGGTVQVETHPGAGTEFRLYFPPAAAAVQNVYSPQGR